MSAPKCPIGHIETLYDAIIAYYREKSNRNNEKCLYLKAIFCVLHNSEKSNSCNFTIPRGLGYRNGDRLAHSRVKRLGDYVFRAQLDL